MIGTANRVEQALVDIGVTFTGIGHKPAVLTRLYSRESIRHFPDTNFQYLRDPQRFRREVVDRHSATVKPEFRKIYGEEL
jgi:hypothetical protein